MDPILKEFVLFFAVWPLVILATIFIGMRLGKVMSRRGTSQASTLPVNSGETVRQVS